MARDLFIDLSRRRLVASATNSAPIQTNFVKGDDGVFTLYFLEPTGIINRPFQVIDKSAASVKLAIGSRTAAPKNGTYTLAFSAETTSDIAVTAGAADLQTALNGLSAISSAGGVSVSGTLENHFTIRFNTAGTQSAITANVSQLIPDTIAIIDERIEGTATEREVQELQLRLSPAVFQDTWTDTTSTVTSTITRVATGNDTTSEVQSLAFSQPPEVGTFRLTYPSRTVTVNSAVTEGVFITSANHGLAAGERVSITGFDTLQATTGGIWGFERGRTYYISEVLDTNQFTLVAASRASGEPAFSTITGTATAVTEPGLISSFSVQTGPISANASAADIQSALSRTSRTGLNNNIEVVTLPDGFEIFFLNEKSNSAQSLLTIAGTLSAIPKKEAVVDFGTFALRDLLENENDIDLDLEIELTESGAKQTVVQATCTVAEELIV
jgi:hypothetical protein